MIITIDGPAGTGKSTVARRVAGALGFDFLDTGAMYRAVALEAIRRKCDLNDPRELAFVARHCRISFDFGEAPPALLLNDERVSAQVRSSEVTSAASRVAAVPAVREVLVAQQQRIGQEHPRLVTEGRDQGTVVFPHAQVKFYLDATPQERARRRVVQLRARGELISGEQVLAEILERDQRDSQRAVGPLSVPVGAQVIDTTELSEDQVVALIVERAREALPADSTPQARSHGGGVRV